MAREKEVIFCIKSKVIKPKETPQIPQTLQTEQTITETDKAPKTEEVAAPEA